ncbi:unnamed protein product [Acanthocheilonema viteae]|uniref:Uncharacterized protein n=1 Tax=Acanthocheilonema viteae TaxID=6277 RepID=A0A498S9V1_ACAVI|nr:unnamed protein product [Acanthocheilonema viteae]
MEEVENGRRWYDGISCGVLSLSVAVAVAVAAVAVLAVSVAVGSCNSSSSSMSSARLLTAGDWCQVEGGSGHLQVGVDTLTLTKTLEL